MAEAYGTVPVHNTSDRDEEIRQAVDTERFFDSEFSFLRRPVTAMQAFRYPGRLRRLPISTGGHAGA